MTDELIIRDMARKEAFGVSCLGLWLLSLFFAWRRPEPAVAQGLLLAELGRTCQ